MELVFDEVVGIRCNILFMLAILRVSMFFCSVSFVCILCLGLNVVWLCFDSEFEDASQDRQRNSSGLSLSSFRRSEYGSSPPTRGDVPSFSRGVHGRWESRSSGRSDRDSDSQSDWDSGKVLHSLPCLLSRLFPTYEILHAVGQLGCNHMYFHGCAKFYFGKITNFLPNFFNVNLLNLAIKPFIAIFV